MVQETYRASTAQVRNARRTAGSLPETKGRLGSERLAQKGLPPLPAIPTMPGSPRWRAMIQQASLLLSETVAEMQGYHDARSEHWQDSTKAEELLAKLEHVQAAIDELDAIE